MRHQIDKLLIFNVFCRIRLLLWVVSELSYGQTGYSFADEENMVWHAQTPGRRIIFGLCAIL